MTLLAALAAALAAHFALRSAAMWWVLAACQPVLLVVVATTRRGRPATAGWLGLAAGLLIDVLADRIIGPGGIAAALAGAGVAVVVARFELQGPLFWTVGALLAATIFELGWWLVTASLGVTPDHAWLGMLATVATTGAAGLVLAAGERALASWRSPERRRRRALRRL